MEGLTLSLRALEAAVKAIGDLRKARKAALQFMPYGTSKPITDKDLAETALTAALAVDGLCLVPKEPTEDMLDFGSCYEDPDGLYKGHPIFDEGDISRDIYRAMLSAAPEGPAPALQGWRTIETFPEDYPHWTSEYDTNATKTKHYEPALVFGATWKGRDDWPTNGGGDWVGPARIAIATTYEGKGFWTIVSDAPNDYDTHVKPTHWQPLPPPPAASEGEERK